MRYRIILFISLSFCLFAAIINLPFNPYGYIWVGILFLSFLGVFIFEYYKNKHK